MRKNKREGNKAQSILEYLAVLVMVASGIVVGTIFFKGGVERGLKDAQNHLAKALPKSVDNTYQGEIKTFAVPDNPEGAEN